MGCKNSKEDIRYIVGARRGFTLNIWEADYIDNFVFYSIGNHYREAEAFYQVIDWKTCFKISDRHLALMQ